jgi:transcriptional regulator with PAS, ATPase and Fis domain
MKVVCAWCRKELQQIDSLGAEQNTITHGICEDCRDNLLFQLGVELQKFLDSLAVPIVVVDRQGTIVTGNGEARTLLRKPLSAMNGYKGGEVFECAYARLPEGCGNTTHCSGCTIRRNVMHTFETGKSSLKVPATLDKDALDGPEKMDLLISTERLTDLVLLRIDRIEAQQAARRSPERAK